MNQDTLLGTICGMLVPDFWRKFYDANPVAFGEYNPNGPVGYLPQAHVYAAMIDILRAHAKEIAK